ncbi:MAG TPA: dipeptidase [Terriglobales bacterium]|nr:dipeptidase [Terriglobales bacterium]
MRIAGRVCALLLLFAGLALAANPPAAGPTPSARAIALAHDAIVIDTHADTTQWMLDGGFDFTKPTQRMVSLDKARQGGLKAEFFSIWVEPRFGPQTIERALDLIDAVRRQAEAHPEQLGLATTAADIRRLTAEHRFAMLMGVEGGHAIADDLAVLRDYYRLGVRYMTLTWSNTNDWADSSGDQDDARVHHHNGLTPFGKEVVAEMNRLGMIVDISHVSDKTFWDAIATTQAPVIASHSSARALVNAPRNMTDAMLRAVARNGGVVQVNDYAAFDSQAARDQAAKFAADEARAEGPVDAAWDGDWLHGYPHIDAFQRRFAAEHFTRPPFRALMDQFVHIIQVAGIDHVGLGSDWDGIDWAPQGMDGAQDIPRIVQGLMDRGYTDAQIRQVLGLNTLRVMGQVEAVARRLQRQPDTPARANSGPVTP